jgi:hypothetical protein
MPSLDGVETSIETSMTAGSRTNTSYIREVYK